MVAVQRIAHSAHVDTKYVVNRPCAKSKVGVATTGIISKQTI